MDKEATAQSLQEWLALLPGEVAAQIELARRHAVPFMPPDVTPEMLSSPNATKQSTNQIQIVCRCIDIAMSIKDYDTAAALIFVVDRAQYRFGQSKPLLLLVSKIHKVSPDTAIAPQVVLRQARVLKDEGDLNGAMKILYSIINKERKWPYQSEQQYQDTKAACLHVDGQIYHNLELWREAILPLVEAVRIFRHVQDLKGISSCVTVLSRCLPRLDHSDYDQLLRTYPDVFQSPHPCYEGYLQGLDAVRHVEHIEARFFAAKHQLVADESLLMYAALQSEQNLQSELLHTILDEVKRSLAGHRAVQFLHSVEAFVEFVRGVFMVSLVLNHSCFGRDRHAARYFEKLSMELYHFMVSRPGGEDVDEPTGSLKQTVYSVALMNQALKLLGLPQLEGTGDFQSKAVELDSGNRVQTGTDDCQLNAETDPEPIPQNRTDQCQNEEASPVQSASAERGQTETSESSSEQWCIVNESKSIDPVSPTPPATQLSGGRYGAYRVNQLKPTALSNLPAKAQTFPAAVSSGRSRLRRHLSVSGGVRRKSVGLPMTLEELRASTCPALSPEARTTLFDEEEEEKKGFLEVNQDELESLTVSTKTYSSESAHSAFSDLSDHCVVAPMRNLSDVCEETTHPECAVCPESANAEDRREEGSNFDTRTTDIIHPTGTDANMSPFPVDKNTDEKRSRTSRDTKQEPSTHVPLSSTSGDIPEKDSAKPLDSKSKCSTVDLDKTTLSSTPGSSNPGSFLVDLSKTTESSSTGTSDSSSSLVDLNKTTKSSSPGTSTSSASPLMDLTASSSEEFMQELNLGECSVETDDPGVFLENWTPLEDTRVNRAVLMTFSPETGKWSSQHTVAYVGAPLKTEKKGAFRDAFHISILHQDEPLGRYVGKRYRKQRMPLEYQKDVVCQMMARNYVTKFNQKLNAAPEDFPRAQFLPAFFLQLENERGEALDWLNVEPYLHGSFLKLTNNHRFVSKDNQLQGEVEAATAFTHFSYVETQGQLMVVDLQGWVPSAGRGVIYLTDPVLHTAHGLKRKFNCDRQEEGMREFWRHVHPECNRICKFLGLDKNRPKVV